VSFYGLEMILAVGFRVRNKRGVQFRLWAITVLKKLMQKDLADSITVGYISKGGKLEMLLKGIDKPLRRIE